MSIALSARPLDLAAEGLPRRGRGRPSPAAEENYQEQGRRVLRADPGNPVINGFYLSASRGWCYLLEKHGLRTRTTLPPPRH